jgi:PAS domain S-box-containing protein
MRDFEQELFASIELSPIATVVTDARRPDNPIVAVNAAFTNMTGYRADEVIGRNCRFLTAAEPDSPGRVALRQAVRDKRAVLAHVVNRKNDGSLFENAVMIAPVRSDGGEVRYFIGTQMEVPMAAVAPVAQAAARRVAALSPRQRQVLAGILDGRRNKQIAADLGIEERTVKMHRAALMKRLGAASTADAIRIGLAGKPALRDGHPA